MTVTKKRKTEVAKKHIMFLQGIYILGNKVIYKKLLEEVCLRFNLAKNIVEFNKIVKELEEIQIIRVEEFENGKVLILKKGGIAIIEKKENSKNVAGVTSLIVHNRLKLTTLRIKYALKFSKATEFEVFLDIFELNFGINKNNFKKMNGLMQNKVAKNIEAGVVNQSIIKDEENRLLHNKMIIENNLKNKIKTGKIKIGIYKGIDYQIANNCYLRKSWLTEEIIKYKVVIFITTEKFHEKNIGDIIAKSFRFYESISEGTCHLEVNIVGYKKHIRDIEIAINKVNKITGLTYIKDSIAKTKGENGGREVGKVIAESKIEIKNINLWEEKKAVVENRREIGIEDLW